MALKRTDERIPPSSPFALIVCLGVLGVVAVLLGLAGALVILIVRAEAAMVTVATVLLSVATFVGGCCVAAVLGALGWLCRNHYHQLLAQRSRAGAQPTTAATDAAPAAAALEAMGGPPAEAGAAAEAAPQPTSPEMVLEQLRELNVNVLLSDSQRAAKRRHLVEGQAQELAEQAEQSAAAGDPGRAQQWLDRLVRLAPDWPGIDQLTRQIRHARAQADTKDLAEATGKTENLMSAGNFDEAEAVADALLTRHPASAPAIALLDRVRRERQSLQAERRARLYQKLEKEVSGRHWRAALSAAREFAQTFPDSPEAEAVRARMDTIADNARLEEVRELRDRIRDLIDRRRFAEAVELAHQVVTKYPDTAAAAELRQQMSRLEERAGDGRGITA